MRLCTFNVHLWTHPDGRRNQQAVLEVLRPLQCDIVVINEAYRGRRLQKIARELASEYAFADAGTIGNAVLSRRPLRDVQVVSLGDGVDPRSALIVTVDADIGPIDIACTHLDPIHEQKRLGQLEDLRRALLARGAAAHIIAGDFNALRLTDYSTGALRAVRRMRQENGREEPRGEVVARMDAWGYLDCFRLARAGGLDGYTRDLRKPIPDEELATCWAGTRVDFIWASRATLDLFHPARYRRVDSNASDHFAIAVDFMRTATET